MRGGALCRIKVCLLNAKTCGRGMCCDPLILQNPGLLHAKPGSLGDPLQTQGLFQAKPGGGENETGDPLKNRGLFAPGPDLWG